MWYMGVFVYPLRLSAFLVLGDAILCKPGKEIVLRSLTANCKIDLCVNNPINHAVHSACHTASDSTTAACVPAPGTRSHPSDGRAVLKRSKLAQDGNYSGTNGNNHTNPRWVRQRGRNLILQEPPSQVSNKKCKFLPALEKMSTV